MIRVSSNAPYRLLLISLLWLALAYLAWGIFREASVMEDAYITFRTVDMFTQGHGLRWNMYERVQSYTHPLWMLLHIPFYSLWENIFFITLYLGAACTFIAVMLPLATFRRPLMAMLCLFLLPLALSRSFLVYSTSGFENSLAHALFALFGWVVLRGKGPYDWLLLSLATSLSMLNRLDVALFYLPVWGYLLFLSGRRVILWQLIAGALPIILWELFSLFYYGMPFSNTKYAKLNTGLPLSDYIRFGINYLLNIAVTDVAATALLLSTLVAMPLLLKRYRQEKDHQAGILFFLGLGSLFYTLYAVYVGGTYLSGRLLTLQIYAAAWMMLALAKPAWPATYLSVAVAVVALVQWSMPHPDKIARYCLRCYQGMDPIYREDKVTLSDYLSGKIQLPMPRSMQISSPVIGGSIGKFGYKAGSDIFIIDNIALSDPLLSRLPCSIKNLGSTGSLPREIPAGYLEAVQRGNFNNMDPGLAQYYGVIRLIITGDLWDGQRLVEIAKFNLGMYDGFLKAYITKIKPN